MSSDNSSIRILRMSYQDRQDEVMRTLPSINPHNEEECGKLYETIMLCLKRGEISSKEAGQMKMTLVKDYGFFPTKYFQNKHPLDDPKGLDNFIDGLGLG